LLYSPEIKAGMSKTEVKPVVRSLLNKWQLDGTINNAQKEVIQGGLYQLMGFR